MPKQSKLTFVERPSPNFGDRKGQSVTFLVQHYTGMDTTEHAIQRLCDPAAQVSSHYVVGEDGTIYRLVAEENRAWHAGVSFWEGNTDLNSSSIGIEIANTGDQPYPKVQMDAVIALSNDIISRYKLRPFNVIGHSDIAPDRKQDPGELFDWAGAQLGVWPSPVERDYDASKNWTDQQLVQNLGKLGYRTTIDLKDLVTAFQRHWQPEAFKTPDKVGTADAEAKARLASLVRRKAISDGIRKAKEAKSGR